MFGFKKKNIDSILDAKDGHVARLGGWIGNRNFTDEERAEMWSKTMADVREYSIKTMSESTERSKSRRYISKLWITVHMLLIVATAVACWIGDEVKYNQMWEMASSYVMMGGTGAILSFFCGAYAYGTHIKTTKTK